MKKKVIIAGAAVMIIMSAVVIGFGVNTNPQVIDLMSANLEALSDSENNKHVGRWRTVACGGADFSHWKTYCCPHEVYDNCPNKGECDADYSAIQGCQ